MKEPYRIVLVIIPTSLFFSSASGVTFALDLFAKPSPERRGRQVTV